MYNCQKCGHSWKGRKLRTPNAKYPKHCPRCQSKIILRLTTINEITKPSTIEQDDIDNQAGQEWHQCMYFNDTTEVPESCTESGINIATIEIPLAVVDITWRENLNITKTRSAAHPSERGCYTTMPLVLCKSHILQLLIKPY